MSKRLLGILMAALMIFGLYGVSLAADAPVNLVFYVMGNPSPDNDAVLAAVNEKLLEKLNCTLEFRFSTWTDYPPKYANELITGTVDMIYTANWREYGTFAKQGAFLPLDDLLDEYAPELKAKAGDLLLNQCRVDGELYTFPGLWPEYTSNGISYREDLREKFDLPVPNTLENMAAYFEGIQANMPEQALLLPAVGDTDFAPQSYFRGAWALNFKYPWVGIGGLKYGLASNYDTPTDVYDYWYSQDFIDDMKLMKEWCDKGFWPKDILAMNSSLDSERYNYEQCIAVVDGENAAKHINHVVYFNQFKPENKSAFIAFGETSGVVYPAHATQNGTGLCWNCKDPALAVQVLSYIMMDEEMNKLVQAGIEGVNYELRDGIYYNLTPEPPFAFPDEGFNTWNLRVKEYKMVKPEDVELNEIFDRLEAVGAKTKFPNVNIQQGMAEDYSEYEAERAAVIAVIQQYLAPLEAGIVDDVEVAVAEFLEKAEAAGLQKCRDGFTPQWLAYCEEFGYK